MLLYRKDSALNIYMINSHSMEVVLRLCSAVDAISDNLKSGGQGPWYVGPGPPLLSRGGRA